MKLEFNRKQLLELMHDFHTLSGIRIVLFDDEYKSKQYMIPDALPSPFSGREFLCSHS